FIARGLDALNYACYQDSRFMIVATPSGVTLAPEGGAHQSIHTPLIGIGQPGLLSYEPAFVDELAVLMRFGLDYMQQPKGSSIYLRLSTRSLQQPERALTPAQQADIVSGGYWYAPPAPGADVAVVAMGAVTPEAIEAHEQVSRDFAGAGLLVLTSPDRLHTDWLAAQRERGRTSGTVDRSPSPVERLLGSLSRDARLVTVMDGHPLALSWLGSVRGQRVVPLGIESFGQSADIPDLYRTYKLDATAIVDAVARSI
ncbi:MAG: transketolase, partial [Alphaproteobacteria bacterium]|nr:transketolase [Alphaproteobacteria bacterium]